MLYLMSKLNWEFLIHPGYHIASWAFRRPGVTKDYEPLYTDWYIKSRRPFPLL